MEDAAKKLLNLQFVLQLVQATPSPCSLHQLFSKVVEMAEHPGEKAWFDIAADKQRLKVPNMRPNSLVSARLVFYRIKEKLPPPPSPSIQEVDDALAKLQEVAANDPVRTQHQQQEGGNIEAAAVHDQASPMAAVNDVIGPI